MLSQEFFTAIRLDMDPDDRTPQVTRATLVPRFETLLDPELPGRLGVAVKNRGHKECAEV